MPKRADHEERRGQADTFRAIVTTAIEQAVATGSGPNPAQTLMIGKIRAALGTPA